MKQTETHSPRRRSSFHGLRTLVGEIFHRHRRRLASGFVALLLVDVMQLSIPKLLQRAINGIDSGTLNQEALLRLTLTMITLAALIVALRFFWRVQIIGFSRLLEQQLRERIYTHLLTLDRAFFSSHSTGDLMARSSNDLGAVQMACGMGMVAAVDAFVMSFAAMGCMAWIDLRLAAIALLPLPLLALATRFLSFRLHRHFARVQAQFAKLTEFSRSTILAINLLKAWTMEPFQTGRFHTLGRTYVTENMAVARIQGLIHPLSTLTGSLGLLLVLFFGGKLVIAGTISIGAFIAFIAYLYMLIWPMIAIGWVINLFQRGLTSLGRVEEILACRPQLPMPPMPAEPLPDRCDFRLQNASLSLGGTTILDDLTLTLHEGTHGLAGRTGSGKSSLCRQLARLHPAEEGSLFFAGIEVNTLPPQAVRSHIAWAGQEPTLFSGTIRDNLTLALPEAGDEQVRQAAWLADFDREIEQFEAGYETIIGERGITLSGGQRQRLSLARALLCQRPVLIIDDGLSAVDSATEARILARLKECNHRLILLVSNRVRQLREMETIHILEEGKLRHSGSHEQLLTASKFYRRMYTRQMEEEHV